MLGVKPEISALLSVKNRFRVFYVLAFVPLVVMLHFHPQWPFAVISPAYGFILLLLKKGSLFSRLRASVFQRALGVAIAVGSFFIYYPLVFFFPRATFYNPANYAMFVFGLFLVFFDAFALREAFTPLLLIMSSTLNSLIFDLLEPVLVPYIGHFVSLLTVILRVFGMNVSPQYPDFILLYTSNSVIPVRFTWGCVGGSTIMFAIILVVLLFEEPAGLRTRLSWAVLGILGTVAVNVLRIVVIFIAYNSYGFEAGEQVHYFLGYALFITWVTLFSLMFSKRQTIVGKIRLIWRRLLEFATHKKRTMSSTFHAQNL